MSAVAASIRNCGLLVRRADRGEARPVPYGAGSPLLLVLGGGDPDPLGPGQHTRKTSYECTWPSATSQARSLTASRNHRSWVTTTKALPCSVRYPGRLDVQMVGRFVEQQQVVAAAQQRGQRDPGRSPPGTPPLALAARSTARDSAVMRRPFPGHRPPSTPAPRGTRSPARSRGQLGGLRQVADPGVAGPVERPDAQRLGAGQDGQTRSCPNRCCRPPRTAVCQPERDPVEQHRVPKALTATSKVHQVWRGWLGSPADPRVTAAPGALRFTCTTAPQTPATLRLARVPSPGQRQRRGTRRSARNWSTIRAPTQRQRRAPGDTGFSEIAAGDLQVVAELRADRRRVTRHRRADISGIQPQLTDLRPVASPRSPAPASP